MQKAQASSFSAVPLLHAIPSRRKQKQTLTEAHTPLSHAKQNHQTNRGPDQTMKSNVRELRVPEGRNSAQSTFTPPYILRTQAQATHTPIVEPASPSTPHARAE